MTDECSCLFCSEMKMEKSGIRTLWRKIMGKKEDRTPKIVVKEKEKYVCPKCLEDTLAYQEEVRLFICGNEHCKKEFALYEVG